MPMNKIIKVSRHDAVDSVDSNLVSIVEMMMMMMMMRMRMMVMVVVVAVAEPVQVAAVVLIESRSSFLLAIKDTPCWHNYECCL